ncbi:MAG: hypothetical protein H7Y88_05020 [Phycisphaerales bacterium]|nr:hypothetical protein [Phycisphaerales bacterium]
MRSCFALGAAVVAMAGAATTASAQQWIEVGPAPISDVVYAGRISAIACSAVDAGRYFIGAADGGVWRSTDAGATWEPLTDDQPTSAIGALVIDPSNEQVIYAGTGEANFANHSRYGLGLLKSTDGGESWQLLAQDTFAGRCFSRIVVDPENTQRLFASVTIAGGFPSLAAAKGHPHATASIGVFRSEDGGATWTHLTNGVPALSATDLAMEPGNADVVYAAIGHIFGHADNGVYKSVDGGESWVKLVGLPSVDIGRISLAVAPAMPQRVVALICREADPSGGGATNIGAFRSDNGGSTWSSHGSVGQATYGWYLSTASIQPANANVTVLGGFDLRRIGGAGPATVTPPHVDMHAIAWDAAGRLLVANDGGLHRSSTLGNTWTALNEGLGSIQFYSGVSAHPSNPAIFLGGAQDNGTSRRMGSGAWDHVVGGDGGWTQIDRTNPLRMFAESQGTGALSRSTDGGGGWVASGSGISGRNCFLPPYLIDPVNPQRMLYGTHRVYLSTNGGVSWSALSGDITAGFGAIRALAQSPTDPLYVYAATNDGHVQASGDGGATFTLVMTGHPGWPRVTRELAVDPLEPQTVYLATATFGTPQVRRSVNAGETWETIDGDLPDVPVNVVAIDASAIERVLYAATDAGVYRTFDMGATWRRAGCGLPNACVIDLQIEPDSTRPGQASSGPSGPLAGWGGRVIGATQGRGLWVGPLYDHADFNADGVVGSSDITAFLARWFQDLSTPALEADFDQSGATGSADVTAFLAAWFASLGGCE